MKTDYKFSDITEKIIGAAYKVYNTLGHGFLEKVYENALVYEMETENLEVKQQESIKVSYDGKVVGDYVADLIVNDRVVVEVKAAKRISKSNEAQLLNYLKATKIDIGLLINFGDRIRIKRRIFDR